MLNSINSNQKLEIAKFIKEHQEYGMVKFENILSVPLTDRIPALVQKYGEKQMHGMLTVMVTEFCNSFNVVRNMNEQQIVACAYELMITSEEDQLAIEDLVIFFQGAQKGIYQKPVFDHVDQAVIFTMLDDYREKRHQSYRNLREERESQLKGLGDVTTRMRCSDDASSVKSLFHNATKQFHSGQMDIKPNPNLRTGWTEKGESK